MPSGFVTVNELPRPTAIIDIGDDDDVHAVAGPLLKLHTDVPKDDIDVTNADAQSNGIDVEYAN